MSTKRVVVIGAGMVGIAAASWLRRDGHSVVVIDPGAPGEGASFGNAGCLNASSVVPMAMPGTMRNAPRWLLDPLGPLAIRWQYLPALAPWLVRFARTGTAENAARTARALRALLGPALASLAPLVKNAGAEHLVEKRGHLVVYRSEESFAKETAQWNLRRDNGVAWDTLGADQLRQLEPALSREYVRGRFIAENGHTSDPYRLVQALADALRRDGAEIRRARATGFELDGQRLTSVRTDGGAIAADAVVVAAGAYSAPLAAALGDKVPLETERGYHLMLRDPEATPHIPTTEAEGKFVATPMLGGLRFAGTVEFAGLRAAPDWRRAHVLLRLGRRMFPALPAAPDAARVSVWMGHRPSLPDSLPVLGPASASPDVIYAFGHGHVGMVGAPMTGKLVADLIAGRDPGIDMAPYRARRFA
ncbi:MAG TPA: FAD-binding oxidoreductase [Stellaceae bacterium]|nr:FAD-binding oxidoreductase [Stellaceae bacterium]